MVLEGTDALGASNRIAESALHPTQMHSGAAPEDSDCSLEPPADSSALSEFSLGTTDSTPPRSACANPTWPDAAIYTKEVRRVVFCLQLD
jgi:hypothetical protein